MAMSSSAPHWCDGRVIAFVVAMLLTLVVAWSMCWCGHAIALWPLPCRHRHAMHIALLLPNLVMVVAVVWYGGEGHGCGCGGIIIVMLWLWLWSSRCDDSLGVGYASVGVYTGPVTK